MKMSEVSTCNLVNVLGKGWRTYTMQIVSRNMVSFRQSSKNQSTLLIQATHSKLWLVTVGQELQKEEVANYKNKLRRLHRHGSWFVPMVYAEVTVFFYLSARNWPIRRERDLFFRAWKRHFGRKSLYIRHTTRLVGWNYNRQVCNVKFYKKNTTAMHHEL